MSFSTPSETIKNQKSSLKKWALVLIIGTLIGIASYFTVFKSQPSTSNDPRKAFATRAMSVSTAPVQQGAIKIFFQGLGTVIPLSNVVVKSRVDGQLMDILFTEGQMVKQGDVLAKIDARSFEVQLKQAQGQLLKDQALLENALIDLKRYEVLLQQDSISKQVLDTQTALVHQYQGTIKVDEASIDSAKLQLDYSTITAPTSGRIGLRLVDKGNMIHASDTTGLAVIAQINPISATFTLPEDKVPAITQALHDTKTLEVEAYDRSDSILIAKGHLASMDNQIDTATGTLKFKAEFDNTENKLFPNQFVNIHLLVTTKQNALYVPSAAIQHGSQGNFVYRVKEDQTVSVQQVKISSTQNGNSIIEEGLNLSDIVVVDGVDKLREGSKVDMNATKETPSKASRTKNDTQK
ncbi:MdtA/MuxA family multidrug efflux RND transporter periplasmic adaptor subunit [Sulfurospirillum diekertiae]|uniref:MdtA/MuxA family multidrug efflux RND transporter periplasmic adaptor subunit n=1 Tax=Sulfurospirillum diekertiae TaxID=1854492 RepID=A0A6G9VSL1_9BACT|nr:MdtA/MuxA family multidrug efflux RND transporter periplasmic adaptor subunit [Sulfurospirillum diekertiae]QIR75858.1 MdtA/MuxA family multidrug efflux RND transporter periplasmic adaptor subunit [Sulfurospirillum diekertiae]QIR78497.1 MdtA/MuxA family multidrug efflux RND transporter periplasmic adaptor subunit [Sulfurospirillum diekertiae]